MKLKDFYAELLKYAPLELSKKLCEMEDGYDNSGLLLECREDVSKVLFTLDLSSASANYAVENGFDLIVTHHPAIYAPVKSLSISDPLTTCMTHSVSVISMHLNMDCAEKGIDYYLSKGLGAKNVEIIQKLGENVGYGRVGDIDILAEDFVESYKKEFETEKVFFFGDRKRHLKKVASFCGSGLDELAVENALAYGADVVASADMKHHVIKMAIEAGLCVLECTHYDCENYGMKKVSEYFKANSKLPVEYFDDDRF